MAIKFVDEVRDPKPASGKVAVPEHAPGGVRPEAEPGSPATTEPAPAKPEAKRRGRPKAFG